MFFCTLIEHKNINTFFEYIYTTRLYYIHISCDSAAMTPIITVKFFNNIGYFVGLSTARLFELFMSITY